MNPVQTILAQLEAQAEKCYLDHGHPDSSADDCGHENFQSCNEALLVAIRKARYSLPPKNACCPNCGGNWVTTPTKGVLVCTACKSTCLPGRQETVTHVVKPR